jgi:hypothetical protein
MLFSSPKLVASAARKTLHLPYIKDFEVEQKRFAFWSLRQDVSLIIVDLAFSSKLQRRAI